MSCSEKDEYTMPTLRRSANTDKLCATSANSRIIRSGGSGSMGEDAMSALVDEPMLAAAEDGASVRIRTHCARVLNLHVGVTMQMQSSSGCFQTDITGRRIVIAEHTGHECGGRGGS